MEIDGQSYIVSTMAASRVGAAIRLRRPQDSAYFTAQWGGGTGTLYVEGSVDGANWDTLRDSSGDPVAFSADPADSSGSASLMISGIAAKYIRGGVTRSAGTSDDSFAMQVHIP